MPSENSGRFAWYDLMTSDPKAAEGFYGRLVGWKPRSGKRARAPTPCGPTGRIPSAA
jgi:predicted enzyme related to lactoylglutathione lyase